MTKQRERGHFMKEMIKLLDKNLKYENHEIINAEIHIWVKSRQKLLPCAYCGAKSNKAHSTYRRTIQDLPISGKKVYLKIQCRKMFCRNAACIRKTFAEKFEFVGSKGKKSLRLEKEIINIAMHSSSTEASRMLSRSTVKISSGTVRNLLKKMEAGQSGEN
jgi:transposase